MKHLREKNLVIYILRLKYKNVFLDTSFKKSYLNILSYFLHSYVFFAFFNISNRTYGMIYNFYIHAYKKQDKIPKEKMKSLGCFAHIITLQGIFAVSLANRFSLLVTHTIVHIIN